MFFNFEPARPNCYVAGMAKKPGDAPVSHNGLNDVIGICADFIYRVAAAVRAVVV